MIMNNPKVEGGNHDLWKVQLTRIKAVSATGDIGKCFNIWKMYQKPIDFLKDIFLFACDYYLYTNEGYSSSRENNGPTKHVSRSTCDTVQESECRTRS